MEADDRLRGAAEPSPPPEGGDAPAAEVQPPGGAAAEAAQPAGDAAAVEVKAAGEAAEAQRLTEAQRADVESAQRERLGRQMHEAELGNAIRDEPLGVDRRFNRFRWYGRRVGGVRRVMPERLLFESGDDGRIGMFSGPDDVAAIRAVLDTRGAREAAFARALDYHAPDATAALAAPPPPIELPAEPDAAELEALSTAHFQRLLKVQTAGMAMLGEDGEVRATDYLPTDPPAVRKIKGELLCVESAIPEQAMADADWPRVAWIKRTQVCPAAAVLPGAASVPGLDGVVSGDCSDRGGAPVASESVTVLLKCVLVFGDHLHSL